MSVEVKVGQRWKRSVWSVPSGWIVKRVKDGVVTLLDPDHEHHTIDRPVSALSEWILVEDIPKVIRGRFGGPDAPEYIVAVGMRVVRIGVDPVIYPRLDATVTGFLRGQVVLTCDGNSVAWDLSRFWDEWRPTLPESRWLDPANVPVGRGIGVCQRGRYGCAYPSRVQPYPPEIPGTPGHCCGACNARSPGPAERFDRRGTSTLTPNVLTPVPRWRTLSKERLYPSTPRVRRTILIEVVDAKSVVYRVSDPCPRPARVPRIRALEGCRTYGHDCHPQWVRA